MVTLGVAVLLATIITGLLVVCFRRKVALPTLVLVLLGLALLALWDNISLTASVTGRTPAVTGNRHGHDALLHDLLGNIRGQARGVLPPGNWVWNDASQFKQKHKNQSPPPPVIHVTAKTGAVQGDTGASSFDSVASATVSSASCDGCTQNTSGPCRHTYLPLCFAFTPNTSECGAHTTPCLGLPLSTDEVRETDPVGDGGRANAAGSARAQSVSADFVFVTASSMNHQCPLFNMLRSLAVSAPSVPVIVYDLENNGSHMDVALLNIVHPNVILRAFAYSDNPDWFRIDVRAGEYAWKPVIIKQVVDEFGSALWVDSGNLAMVGSDAAQHKVGPFDVKTFQEDYLAPKGFYSPRSQQTPWHWVHPGTYLHFGMKKCCGDSKRKPCCCCGEKIPRCNKCEGSALVETNATYWMSKAMCNGALIAFSTDSPGYDKVLVPWYRCALDRSCIAPDGPGAPSHRGNHRQDQATLTMIAILNDMPCIDKEKKAGFKLHQDNRWTNTSFCDVVFDKYHRPGAAPTNIAPESPSRLPVVADGEDNNGNSLTTGAASVEDTAALSSWKRWPQRADILTNACLKSTAAEGAAKSSSGPKLTHVINPFNAGEDVHFSWTLPAIEAAHARAQSVGISVELLAITFTDEKVPVPDIFTVLPIIDPARMAGQYLQDIGVEFDAAEKPLKGPIVSDVWQAIYNYSAGSTVIWSNYDLIVHPDFYVHIANALDPQKNPLHMERLSGFSSLRKDLHIPRATVATLDDWTVADFYAWNFTKPQAGHDCMVFPKRWLPCMDMAHMAFGVGGWDHAIYSQMKYLASLEGDQFRTLSPGKGFPEHGLTRHIGSQVANTKKFWTNPVGWKGPAREAQYNFNKRRKAEIEMYLKTVSSFKFLCKRPQMNKCVDMAAAAAAGDATAALPSTPNNDYRLVGLATTAPHFAQQFETVVRSLSGYRVVSAHRLDLSIEGRNTAMTITSHAADLFAGPKPQVLTTAQDPPMPGKKGRILRFRAVAVMLDNDPVASVLSMAITSGAPSVATEEDLAPYVEQYATFWRYWLGKADGSAVAVSLFKLDPTVPRATLTTELTILHQFLVYHRCGPSDQAKCHTRSTNHGVCCGLNLFANSTKPTAPAIDPKLADWIREELASTVEAAEEAWERLRAYYPWPSTGHCCDDQ